MHKRGYLNFGVNVSGSCLKHHCSSSVYVEGDIETRVYNDSINGEVKSIPEICVRRDERLKARSPYGALALPGVQKVPTVVMFIKERRGILGRRMLLSNSGCSFTSILSPGKLRLIKGGESIDTNSLDGLRASTTEEETAKLATRSLSCVEDIGAKFEEQVEESWDLKIKEDVDVKT
ncbi:hypothetical protein Ahy_B02g060575 [Arachis hypogaea]|uniref:Uncharacterized protein n=1 Tax=Arachis hypogaea TaxID=3818 RepID=A0A445AIT6_ARAHY|nr:hypothetical protein Ahy_B02g060575 [Arachis hypogaea]